MKNVSLLMVLVLSTSLMVGALSAQDVKASAPESEDIGLLFDGGEDALDAVTVDGCGHDVKDLAQTPEPSAFQVYYQSALLYMLSSYFAAKKFIISHMPHVPWSKVPASSTEPNAAA